MQVSYWSAGCNDISMEPKRARSAPLRYHCQCAGQSLGHEKFAPGWLSARAVSLPRSSTFDGGVDMDFGVEFGRILAAWRAGCRVQSSYGAGEEQYWAISNDDRTSAAKFKVA